MNFITVILAAKVIAIFIFNNQKIKDKTVSLRPCNLRKSFSDNFSVFLLLLLTTSEKKD